MRHEFHISAASACRLRVYSANAVACKLKQRALPGDRVASALDTVLLCHELVAWGEVLGLYVDHAQASLLDHMLAELRVHTDRLYQRFLDVCGDSFDTMPFGRQSSAINVLGALQNVVRRHYDQLVDALTSGAAFVDVQGGKHDDNDNNINNNDNNIHANTVNNHVLDFNVIPRPNRVMRFLRNTPFNHRARELAAADVDITNTLDYEREFGWRDHPLAIESVVVEDGYRDPHVPVIGGDDESW
eukprot:CAMPEP_0168599852 /NCGR_PEP_ID=MMETSP0420-20121227/12375_1 /TAXON_ID=498008 /ORGANISM="Pessonella sp." /LENGTH=243 /DNA_ID=CAMNT_0008637711 /DNA_START=264 /DNA_END=992 /DNA_ORIENTATION=+